MFHEKIGIRSTQGLNDHEMTSIILLSAPDKYNVENTPK